MGELEGEELKEMYISGFVRRSVQGEHPGFRTFTITGVLSAILMKFLAVGGQGIKVV